MLSNVGGNVKKAASTVHTLTKRIVAIMSRAVESMPKRTTVGGSISQIQINHMGGGNWKESVFKSVEEVVWEVIQHAYNEKEDG